MSAGIKQPAIWAAVIGIETRNSRELLSERKTQNKTVRLVKETEEQYVLFSCGHSERRVNFNANGKGRKRVRCWECERAALSAATGLPQP